MIRCWGGDRCPIQRYEVIAQIGKGWIGELYRAIDTNLKWASASRSVGDWPRA